MANGYIISGGGQSSSQTPSCIVLSPSVPPIVHNGNTYVIGFKEETSGDQFLSVFKRIDPTPGSPPYFTELDTANRKLIFGSAQVFYPAAGGSTVYCSYTTASFGQPIKIITFDLSSETWGAIVSSGGPVAQQSEHRLVHRSNGDWVVAYNSTTGPETIDVWWVKYNGSWSSPVKVSTVSTAANDLSVMMDIATNPSTDDVAIFWNLTKFSEGYTPNHRYLTILSGSGDSLGSNYNWINSTASTDWTANGRPLYNPAQDRWEYSVLTAPSDFPSNISLLAIAEFTPSSSPVVTITPIIGGANSTVASGEVFQPRVSLDSTNQVLYYMWADCINGDTAQQKLYAISRPADGSSPFDVNQTVNAGALEWTPVDPISIFNSSINSLNPTPDPGFWSVLDVSQIYVNSGQIYVTTQPNFAFEYLIQSNGAPLPSRIVSVSDTSSPYDISFIAGEGPPPPPPFVPKLLRGPVKLPELHYLSVGFGAQVRGEGPFSSPSNQNRKAIIVIICDDLNIQTATGHMAAMVSSNGGSSWSEVPGPAVYMAPMVAVPPLPASQVFFPNFQQPMYVSANRIGEDIFTINTLQQGDYSLLKFNLQTFSWTVINAAIASYSLVPITYSPGGNVAYSLPLQAVFSWYNDGGYGLAGIFDGVSDQQILRFTTGGSVIGIDTIIEPDSGWNGGNPGFRVLSAPGAIFGTSPDGTMINGIIETNGLGDNRLRVVTWDSTLSGHSLSIANPASPISIGPDVQTVAKFGASTHPSAEYYNTQTGDWQNIEAIPPDSGFNVSATTETIPQIGTLLQPVFPVENNSVSTIQSPQRSAAGEWGDPAVLYSTPTGDGSIAPMSFGVCEQALPDSTGIELLTSNFFRDVHPNSEQFWTPLWYWLVGEELPPPPPAPSLHTVCVVNPNSLGFTDIPYIVRSYQFNIEKMPPDTIYFTPWSDLGWAFQKVARNLMLDIDTAGVACSIQVQVDGATAQTVSVTSKSNDRDRVIALNSDIEGKLFRLAITPGVGGKSQVFTAGIDFIPDVNIVKYYDSYETDFGYPGWKYIKQAWLDFKGGPITIDFIVDQGLVFHSVTLDANRTRAMSRFYLPASANGVLNKSKKYRIKISGKSGFRLYANSRLEWFAFATDQRGSFNLFPTDAEQQLPVAQPRIGAWSL